MREESAERLMLPPRTPATGPRRPPPAERGSVAPACACRGAGCGTPYPATSNKLPIRET